MKHAWSKLLHYTVFSVPLSAFWNSANISNGAETPEFFLSVLYLLFRTGSEGWKKKLGFTAMLPPIFCYVSCLEIFGVPALSIFFLIVICRAVVRDSHFSLNDVLDIMRVIFTNIKLLLWFNFLDLKMFVYL